MSSNTSTTPTFESLPFDLKSRIWQGVHPPRSDYRHNYAQPTIDEDIAAWMGRNAFPFCKRATGELGKSIELCRTIIGFREEFGALDESYPFGTLLETIHHYAIDPALFCGLIDTISKRVDGIQVPLDQRYKALGSALTDLYCEISDFNNGLLIMTNDLTTGEYEAAECNAAVQAYIGQEWQGQGGKGYLAQLDSIEAQAREVVKLTKEAGLYY